MAFLSRLLLMMALAGMGLFSASAQNAPATDGPVSPSEDILEFLSGDILRGRLVGMDANGLRWQHSPEGTTLTIKPRGVYKVRLARTRPVPPHGTDSVVRLVNGDEIRGELQEMDDQTLVLRTWYAGNLRLQRQGLASLLTGLSRYKVIYEGPDSMSGWTNLSGVRTDVQFVIVGGVAQLVSPETQPRAVANGWHYHNGAFYGVNAGFLGRQLDLPPVSNIEFDLSWQGNFYLSIWFYTDRPASPDGNAYMLQVSPRNLQLCRATRTGNNMSLGMVDMPEGTRKIRLSIRTDIPNKTVAVYGNDVLLRQWLDISNLEGLGTGLGFYLAGMAQQVRIANLRVTAWDGQIDNYPETPVARGQELVRLLNKDRVAGRVKAIRKGELLLQADFGELPLPLERVAAIEFAAAKTTNAAPIADASQLVRAFLNGGGRLTMLLENWDERQVTASGPFFERAQFHPALFQSLQFNLNQARLDLDFFDAPAKFRVAPEILLDNF
ncbi:MAG: hypothetical protein N3J91_16540 [Verrucomicrobiae bacterium]|nr:hypothetical protein [Verrucomicrobiae bacterium]